MVERDRYIDRPTKAKNLQAKYVAGVHQTDDPGELIEPMHLKVRKRGLLDDLNDDVSLLQHSIGDEAGNSGPDEDAIGRLAWGAGHHLYAQESIVETRIGGKFERLSRQENLSDSLMYGGDLLGKQ